MCCSTVRDVTEQSVTVMCTICLSSREVVHLGGCDRPRRSVVPRIQRLHIRITVVWFRPTRLPIFLKDNPQSRGRTVAYRDCGLPFKKIGSRVGRNQTTVMRICEHWMQEGTTDRRGRSHLPQCTTSREDKQIVRMAVIDCSVTSRTVEQHIQCVRVPFDNVYSKVVRPQDVHWLVYPCAEPQTSPPPMVPRKRMWVAEWN
ncbi:uncharacterized protein TNCV_4757491 [Trichonephila clavipes]|nr:uncharacterized protein TNCV_4757491 [Trichonephila clavipes]